jgi:pimeloyl-ACP methyl ester carboxylesterase
VSYQPVRAPRHEKMTVRGIEHHVVRWGPEDDDPVVLLHGWADTADTFQFMVDALARERPLAAFDWRGFGRSGWQEGGYWFPDYLADLEVMLDALCPRGPARLVGHSMGGNIALLYAGIRPERVRRVCSLEGFGLPRSAGGEAPERYREWLQQLREPPAFGEFGSYDDLAHYLVRRNPRLDRSRAEFIARSWATAGREGKVRIAADPAHKRVNPYRYRRDEAEACWHGITAPALLVMGEDSDYRRQLGPDGQPEALAAAFPQIRVETLPDAGHMLHHECPEAVAGIVERFLDG